jgi:hypothetical protein
MTEIAAAVEGRRLMLRPLEETDAPALFDAVLASREVLKRRLTWVDGVREPRD